MERGETERKQEISGVTVFVNLPDAFCVFCLKQDAPLFALEAIWMLSDCIEENMWDFMKDAV